MTKDISAEASVAQASLDTGYQRAEERLGQLRRDLEKLPRDGKEAAALEKQIKNFEQQQEAARKRHEANVTQLVYGDILWGLFNSTEFTFNH